MRQHRTLLLLPVGVLATLAAAAVYQIHFFLLIPADLLSFAESPFISDIIRIKAGLPLFSPPGDNNSYPYSPGTQLLTYALASIVGTTDSVPVVRNCVITPSVSVKPAHVSVGWSAAVSTPIVVHTICRIAGLLNLFRMGGTVDVPPQLYHLNPSLGRAHPGRAGSRGYSRSQG